jgi:hypothetical protein
MIIMAAEGALTMTQEEWCAFLKQGGMTNEQLSAETRDLKDELEQVLADRHTRPLVGKLALVSIVAECLTAQAIENAHGQDWLDAEATQWGQWLTQVTKQFYEQETGQYQ